MAKHRYTLVNYIRTCMLDAGPGISAVLMYNAAPLLYAQFDGNFTWTTAII